MIGDYKGYSVKKEKDGTYSVYSGDNFVSGGFLDCQSARSKIDELTKEPEITHPRRHPRRGM